MIRQVKRPWEPDFLHVGGCEQPHTHNKKEKVIAGQHGCVYSYCSSWVVPKDDKLFHVMFHRKKMHRFRSN